MTPFTSQVEVPVKNQKAVSFKQSTSIKTTTYSKKKMKKEEQEIKQKTLKGLVPYMVADSGTTSSCGRPNDPFIKTGQPSTTKFHRQVAQATKTAQLQHQVSAPANTIDIIPASLTLHC